MFKKPYTAQQLLDKLKKLSEQELKKPIYYYDGQTIHPIKSIDTSLISRVDLQ